MDDKWLRLEEIVRRVVREELNARKPASKQPSSIRLEGRTWVGITESQTEAWRSAYPSVEIDGELRRAAAWILSNPSDAPKTQFGRFLNAWLSRNQNGHAMRTSKESSITSKPATPFRACSVCNSRANLQVNGEWRCVTHRFDDGPLLRVVSNA